MALHSKLLLLLPSASGVTATLAWTEENDTWSIVASAPIVASVAWTEENDTWSIVASATIVASVAWTEADDVYLLNASVTSANFPVIPYYGGRIQYEIEREKQRKKKNKKPLVVEVAPESIVIKPFVPSVDISLSIDGLNKAFEAISNAERVRRDYLEGMQKAAIARRVKRRKRIAALSII